LKYFFSALVTVALVACADDKTPAPVQAIDADLVIRSANIWTGDRDTPRASAIAVRGNRIVAVGDDAAVANMVGPGTELIDSPPGLVLPGFIDSHVHIMPSGFELSSVKLRDADSPEEFSRRIGEFAQGLDAGTWIQGGTWDHQNWGGELPHRDWVDPVTPHHPVMVVRLDGHMVLANSLALELAGVDKNTADVAGGEIVRDADGTPTGVLKDNAMDLVAKVIPRPSTKQEDDALLKAMDYLASHGVTTVHDMSYDWDGLATYRRAHAANALKTRIYANVPIADHARLAAEIADNGRGDEWLRIGGVKGFMDGSLGSHTAAMFEPFSDTPGDTGLFMTEPAQMRQYAIAADAAGLQLNIHAIGTRANAELLDIFSAVHAVNGEGDRRFRIEHAQHLRQKEIVRIAATGVIPSMQPFHAIDDGRWAESVIGPERARFTYAFRSLLDVGATVAFGSDWSVAPADPLYGIYAATTRRTLDGAHPDGWVPLEKITVEEALAAYTRNGAYASFEEDAKGSLATGKLADIVILEQDITRMPLEEIRDVKVVRTIVDGRTVYKTD
jgi:predicted amidohydrolase YtcJ